MPSRQTPVRPAEQPAERGQPGQRDRVLTREIVTLAAVVVLGSIMTILDATIVNVALPTLGREFGTSISVIQWVPTIYLLAFASVIPLTGWASERFGARRVWLASLAVFMLGSLLFGPVAGPVIGGAIVGSATWRWIFFVNLPVGAVALALALWLLPAATPQ